MLARAGRRRSLVRRKLAIELVEGEIEARRCRRGGVRVEEMQCLFHTQARGEELIVAGGAGPRVPGGDNLVRRPHQLPCSGYISEP